MREKRERPAGRRVSSEELIAELHQAVDGLAEDRADRGDLKILARAMRELRHSFRVFSGMRGMRKVTVFGSARCRSGSPEYRQAAAFGKEMARRGWLVITGGGEGIMEAAHVGAGQEMAMGINILLPFEKGPPRILHDDPKVVKFRYFFTRKVFFVMEADAVALFPGGFGTHDEGFEVLTLLQTGKAPPMPVVLMEPEGERYWDAWDRFVREELLARRFVSPEDLSLYRIARSPEEATDWIASYYSTYHSSRQVGHRLVVRLEHDLTDAQIRALNEGFRDIVAGGRIERTPALPEEADEPALADKPRIAFAYDRGRAGRVNELILEINRLGGAA